MMHEIKGDDHEVRMIHDATDADVESLQVISDNENELLNHDDLFGDVDLVPVGDTPCPRPTMRLWGKRSCFDLTAP